MVRGRRRRWLIFERATQGIGSIALNVPVLPQEPYLHTPATALSVCPTLHFHDHCGRLAHDSLFQPSSPHDNSTGESLSPLR